MRVLVTGASGFLGTYLCRALLARGDAVVGLARPGSRLPEGVERAEGDLRDPASIVRAARGCGALFHAAAVLGFKAGQEREQEEANVLGTRAACAAALEAGVGRVVHISSVAAVGLPPEGTVASERSPFTPESGRTSYARTKHAAELEVLEAVERGLDAVLVNPAVIYGVRPNRHHTLNLLETLCEGRLRAFPTGGTGWVWVEDVVRGTLLAHGRGTRGRRYILGGENLPYLDFMRAVCREAGSRAPFLPLPSWLLVPAASVLGRRSPISAEAARLSSRRLYYDSGLAARELGWTPTPFAEAVRASVAAWRAARDA